MKNEKFMAQQFLKVIRGNFSNIEKKVDDFFLTLFENHQKVSGTRYYMKDEDITVFITYYSSV